MPIILENKVNSKKSKVVLTLPQATDTSMIWSAEILFRTDFLSLKMFAATLLIIINILLCLLPWGFFGHQHINRLAVFTLPPEMSGFYKNNLTYISAHAVDPDKRRYADTAEAPRHFIDIENYENGVIDSIPGKWDAAVLKYSEAGLQENGIVPWHIERVYFSLVKAFRTRDMQRILKVSADLGHYIADAHVPLHTTQNYNGQLSGQTGIHGFWESRLPELFSGGYNFLVGPAVYVSDPREDIWNIVKAAHSCLDSVLLIEARLNATFPSDHKYTYSERNRRVDRQYSEEYSQRYHDLLGGMVERQMRSSVLATGSFWYSAWVDAGQPELSKLKKTEVPDEETAATEKQYQKGRIIGREEN